MVMQLKSSSLQTWRTSLNTPDLHQRGWGSAEGVGVSGGGGGAVSNGLLYHLTIGFTGFPPSWDQKGSKTSSLCWIRH